MTVFVAAQNSGGLTDALLIGLFLCIAFPPVVSTVLQTVPLSLTSSISMKQSQFRLILNIFISFFSFFWTKWAQYFARGRAHNEEQLNE